MAIDVAESINSIVNKVTTEVLTADLPQKTADTVCTIVNASFKLVEEGLKAVQNITAPPAPTP